MKWLLPVFALLFLQSAATVSLSPDSGPPGASLEVSGSGFVPGERVRILWDGASMGGTVKVEPDGTFAYRGTVPTDATPGSHTVDARARESGTVTAGFTVTTTTTTTTTTTSTSVTSTSVTSTTATSTTAATTAATVPPTTDSGPSTTVISTATTTGASAGSDIPSSTPSPTTTAGSQASPTTTAVGTAASLDTNHAPDGQAGGAIDLLPKMLVWLAAIAGAFVLLARRRPSRNDETDAPGELGDPGVSTPEPLVEGRDGSWARNPVVLRPRGRIDDLLVTPDGLIAVGATSDEDAAAVWRSADGVEWESVAVLERGRAGIALAWRGGLITLGSIDRSDGLSGCCWTSEKGASWHRPTDDADPVLAGVLFEGAAAWGDVVVAHGRGPTGPGLWTSHDGASWNEVPLPADVDVVASLPDGLLALGRWKDDRRPMVARSTDGLVWTGDTDDPFAFDGASVTSLVPFEGGLVATGVDMMRNAAAVWVSDQGSRWLRAPFDPGPGTSIDHLTSVDERLVAVGRDTGPHRTATPGAIAVWESHDAVSWERLEDTPLLAHAIPTSVAVRDGAALVLGNLVPGRGSPWSESTPAVWTREPLHAPVGPEPVSTG